MIYALIEYEHHYLVIVFEIFKLAFENAVGELSLSCNLLVDIRQAVFEEAQSILLKPLWKTTKSHPQMALYARRN